MANASAPLSLDEISSRLVVNCDSGRCYWKDATKFHIPLNGKEAGSFRHGSGKRKGYWVIKINGLPYKRSQIVLAVSSGKWPNECVDHINGNTQDDRAANLRHASVMQNSWNHRSRAKKEQTPMGVRRLPSGKFQARITCNKRHVVVGVFPTPEEARAAYVAKRKEFFGDYSGL